MARLRPLRALRYDTALAGPLSDVISPPYDVISPGLREVLESRSPFNFVHLDLPRAAAGRGAEAEAARRLADWRSRGILRLDDRPCLTLYAQQFASAGKTLTRHGFFGRLGIDFDDRGEVLPHERTFDKHVNDRKDLSRTTGAVLSPVFVLYQDPSGEAVAALARAAGESSGARSAGEATDDEGTRHRVAVVDDEAAIRSAQAAIARGPVMIADGHHRYRAARELALEVNSGRPPAGDDPRAWLQAVFVRAEDPGLQVLPTHRVVRAGADQVSRLVERIRSRFEVRATGDPLGDAAGLPRGAGHFVLVAGGGEAFRVSPRPGSDAFAEAGLAPSLAGADTALVDEALIERELGVSLAAAAVSGAVTYEREAAAAVEAVRRGDASAAFLLAATPVEMVFRSVRGGALFPRKSTFFHPKLASGLVVDALVP